MIPSTVQQQRELNGQLAQFEGLVYETARKIVAAGVELEIDDVRQLLRIKITYAIGKYDASRDRVGLQRFVFGCVANYRKDLLLRPRRFNRSIEALREDPVAGDHFDMRYLSSTAEEVFFEIEDEEPAWMDRLTCVERQVVRLRAEGRELGEIDRALGLGRDRARFVMQSVREKLADWRPPGDAPRSVPTPPLPGVEPRTARPQLARAA